MTKLNTENSPNSRGLYGKGLPTRNSGWLRRLTSPSITMSFQSSMQWSVTTALIACEKIFYYGVINLSCWLYDILHMLHGKVPFCSEVFPDGHACCTGWSSKGHSFPCSVLGRDRPSFHHSIISFMHGRVECHRIRSCCCAFSFTTQIAANPWLLRAWSMNLKALLSGDSFLAYRNKKEKKAPLVLEKGLWEDAWAKKAHDDTDCYLLPISDK